MDVEAVRRAVRRARGHTNSTHTHARIHIYTSLYLESWRMSDTRALRSLTRSSRAARLACAADRAAWLASRAASSCGGGG